MSSFQSDKVFSGSIPALYEEYLVPLIFQPYAEDLARRVATRRPSLVLEIAAGTGVVTRQLASVLPEASTIVATDLNRAMLEHAARIGASRPVQWQEADAMDLPFEAEAFDAVVCQFGVMFFPDKAKAFAEARRVLRPGGTLLFNVWDHIAHNEFAATVTSALASLFPEDPPNFLARTPYGYHDSARIDRYLRDGGFTSAAVVQTVSARSRAASPRIPALAFCQGTPLRNEIEARAPSRLEEATDHAAAAIAQQFGSGPVEAEIRAHVIEVER